ncbi:MAG: hypothetical protein M1827_007069 [Pycnora praestabilis]|nr:MAG: hypothetical protein M1827_007069 [Pycnora praestabilis]
MDPTGPEQPNLDTAYETAGNPAEQTPSEQHTAAATAHTNTAKTTTRSPNDVSIPRTQGGIEDATPSALGAGGHGEEDRPQREVGTTDSELEGEQMRAPGEGEIMAMQGKKTGMGEQKSLTSDLDRKKEEQAPERERIMGERKQGVDVDGALGDRGGPATVEGR